MQWTEHSFEKKRNISKASPAWPISQGVKRGKQKYVALGSCSISVWLLKITCNFQEAVTGTIRAPWPNESTSNELGSKCRGLPSNSFSNPQRDDTFLLLLVTFTLFVPIQSFASYSFSFYLCALWCQWPYLSSTLPLSLPFLTLLQLEQHLGGKHLVPFSPAHTLCCSCSHHSCSHCFSLIREPKQDLSICPSSLMWAASWSSNLPASIMQPFSVAIQLPHELKATKACWAHAASALEWFHLEWNPRQLTLTCLWSTATRATWHHVSSASAREGVGNDKIILQRER